MISRAAALFFSVFTFFEAGALWADPQALQLGSQRAAIAIFPVLIGERETLDLSAVVRSAQAAVEGRPGLSLVTQEALFVADPGETLARLRDCGADPTCLADEMAQFRVGFGLVVLVNSLVDPPLLALRIVDAKKRQIVASDAAPVEMPETPATAISARAARLLDSIGFRLGGHLVISVAPKNASISVQGAGFSQRDTPDHLRLVSGRYRVRADLSGYLPAETEVLVENDREARVSLTLQQEPGVFSSPWFWLAIGAVFAGAASAAVIASLPSASRVCIATPGDECPLP